MTTDATPVVTPEASTVVIPRMTTTQVVGRPSSTRLTPARAELSRAPYGAGRGAVGDVDGTLLDLPAGSPNFFYSNTVALLASVAKSTVRIRHEDTR